MYAPKQLYGLPIVNSQKSCEVPFHLKESLLWNKLGNEIKGVISVFKFRKEVHHLDGLGCHYN